MKVHVEILDEIVKVLADNGFESETEQLQDEIRACFTGSELCLRCGSKLLTLQNTNKQLSPLVGRLIREFISYCHANGLYPSPDNEA